MSEYQVRPTARSEQRHLPGLRERSPAPRRSFDKPAVVTNEQPAAPAKKRATLEQRHSTTSMTHDTFNMTSEMMSERKVLDAVNLQAVNSGRDDLRFRSDAPDATWEADSEHDTSTCDTVDADLCEEHYSWQSPPSRQTFKSYPMGQHNGNKSKLGPIIIIIPTDGFTQLKSLDPIRLSTTLQNKTQNGILAIRRNVRLNLLTVETKNTEAAAALTKSTTLCGVEIETYETCPPKTTVGIIHGIPGPITVD